MWRLGLACFVFFDIFNGGFCLYFFHTNVEYLANHDKTSMPKGVTNDDNYGLIQVIHAKTKSKSLGCRLPDYFGDILQPHPGLVQ